MSIYCWAVILFVWHNVFLNPSWAVSTYFHFTDKEHLIQISGRTQIPIQAGLSGSVAFSFPEVHCPTLLVYRHGVMELVAWHGMGVSVPTYTKTPPLPPRKQWTTGPLCYKQIE